MSLQTLLLLSIFITAETRSLRNPACHISRNR
jgi:hypothetical protein